MTTLIDSPPPPESIHPQWLCSVDALENWLAALQDGQPVGLDSEFERTTTFYARPGLVQLAAGEQAWLVEPEVVAASAAFREFLSDPERPKLLYAMSEDLDLFREWLGVLPQGLIDLQLAGAFSGYGMSVGFAGMVQQVLGIELDKGQTRSDWLQRPLTEGQQRYAMADALYLLPLFQHFRGYLRLQGRMEALVEESAGFARDQAAQGDEQSYYLRVRGGWQLSPERQAVLRRLCMWREKRCRELDRPRGHVVGDKLLIAIAQELPRNLKSLGRIENLPPVVVRKHGEAMLNVIECALDEGVPQDMPLIAAPLSRSEQQCFRAVKQILKKALHDTGIPVELMAPRRRLEPQIRAGLESGEVPAMLCTGWRGKLLSDWKPQLQELFQ